MKIKTIRLQTVQDFASRPDIVYVLFKNIYKKLSSNSTSKSMNSISADADNVKYDEFKILFLGTFICRLAGRIK